MKIENNILNLTEEEKQVLNESVKLINEIAKEIYIQKLDHFFVSEHPLSDATETIIDILFCEEEKIKIES